MIFLSLNASLEKPINDLKIYRVTDMSYNIGFLSQFELSSFHHDQSRSASFSCTLMNIYCKNAVVKSSLKDDYSRGSRLIDFYQRN